MAGLKKNQVGLLEVINAVSGMRNRSSEITAIPIRKTEVRLEGNIQHWLGFGELRSLASACRYE